MLRKTKIICTLGPATESEEMLRELVLAGANVFRLNMSHAKHDWCRDVVGRIRKVASETGKPVSTLVDLQGPSIRTGEVAANIDLKVGDAVEFTLGDAAPALPYSTSVNYPGLGADLKVGDRMLVDNGEIHVLVKDIASDRITCEAETDGCLTSRRHINLPGVLVNLPPLTEKDHRDIALAAELAVDFVAMSFVRDAAHVEKLRGILQEIGSVARIVAKIEDQHAVENLDGIIEAADAVMVARGDLGIEVHLEELPVVQRRIVKRCVHLGRKVIVATHMLESMTHSPVPTRAEVTDVANAAFEEADAVMLSGETSVGEYPTRCVEVLDRVCSRMEESERAGYAIDAPTETEKRKMAKSAVLLADSLEGAKIVVFTEKGRMAHHVAHLRPEKAPIFAFSPAHDVCQSLNLSRAVYPFQMEIDPGCAAQTIESSVATLKAAGHVSDGDALVMVSDMWQGLAQADAVWMKRV